MPKHYTQIGDAITRGLAALSNHAMQDAIANLHHVADNSKSYATRRNAAHLAADQLTTLASQLRAAHATDHGTAQDALDCAKTIATGILSDL
jgi:hypothetical protein